jgi:hypothetical protein
MQGPRKKGVGSSKREKNRLVLVCGNVAADTHQKWADLGVAGDCSGRPCDHES